LGRRLSITVGRHKKSSPLGADGGRM
jgi:hypothetical protein